MKKILFLFFFVGKLYAFNWDKCTKKYKNPVLGLPISTSSFISSTGDCAMIGEVDHDKRVFYAQNYEYIKVDIARGGGEYISAYGVLVKCSPQTQKKLPDILQSNFHNIYGNDFSYSPEETYKNLEKIMVNFGLGNDCSIKG